MLEKPKPHFDFVRDDIKVCSHDVASACYRVIDVLVNSRGKDLSAINCGMADLRVLRETLSAVNSYQNAVNRLSRIAGTIETCHDVHKLQHAPIPATNTATKPRIS